MVADRVDVETRHPDDDDSGWAWSFDGGARYTLRPIDRERVGSRVTLQLAAEAVGYLRPEKLATLVRRYADFLDVPITVGSSGEPVNAQVAPWDREDGVSEARLRSLLARRLPEERLLSVIPIDVPLETAHGARLAGALAIRGGDASGLPGRTDLYVRRMFITAEQPGLLPPWAQFLCGVIECDGLTPTASRDHVLRDEVLEEARDHLERALLAHLDRLSREAPTELVGLLRLHSHALLGLLASPATDDALFDALAHHVPLRQLGGEPRPIPDHVRASGDGVRLRTVRRRETARQLMPLCRARGLVVLDLDQPRAQDFVARYASRFPNRLEPIAIDEAGAGDLLAPLPASEAMTFRPLRTAAQRVVTPDAIEVVRLGVSTVDAIRLETKRGLGRRALSEVSEELGQPDFLAAALAPMATSSAGEAVLYLNADSPLVRRLAERNRLDEEPDADVLRALIDQAVVRAGQEANGADEDDRRARTQRLWLRLLGSAAG